MNQLVLVWQFFMRCLGFGPGPCLMMIRKDGRTVCRPSSDNHPRFFLSMWWRQRQSTVQRRKTSSQSETAKCQTEMAKLERRNAGPTGNPPTSEFASDDSAKGVSLSGEPPAHVPRASSRSKTDRPGTSISGNSTSGNAPWPFGRILSSDKRAGTIGDQRNWIPQHLGHTVYWAITCWSVGSLSGLANFRMGSLQWCWT